MCVFSNYSIAFPDMNKSELPSDGLKFIVKDLIVIFKDRLHLKSQVLPWRSGRNAGP